MNKNNKQHGVFVGEWRNLLKNRVLLISSLVLFLIPILYGGFFLGGIWNPYGRTSDIPVAIVNEDQPAVVAGKTLTIGKDVVDTLQKNHDMKWEFVSAADAEKGLENGYYYMRITLPNNFSKNAASITSPNPVKSDVLYTLTPSKNYVGSLISNQAAEKVISSVKSEITKQYVSSILESVEDLQSGLSQAASGSGQLAQGALSLNQGITAYTIGVGSLQAGSLSLAQGTQQLANGANGISTGLSSLSSGLPTTAQITQLSTGLQSVQTGLSQLKQSLQTADSTLANTVATNAATVASDLTAYATIATTNQAAIANITSEVSAAMGASEPTITVTTADAAAVLQVVSTAATLASHTQTLLQNLQSLTTALSVQSYTMSTTVGSLSGGMDTLTPNVVHALTGYTSVSSATGQLTSGSQTLASGLTTAHEGAVQLYNGTTQLSANNGTLTSGSVTLTNGVNELASRLASASDQLAIQPTGAATTEQIANPVASVESDKGSVPNYGFALSPYVLVLGLYVGALTFSVIYPLRSKFGQTKHAFEWFMSKWSMSMFVGIGQVIILSAGMVGILGLRPVDPLGFVVMLLASSFTYMAITTALAIAFDNPGRFVAMILLVLQLGAAEGTFPIITSAPFFQAINPFLPMTYAIRGMRVAISGDVGGQTVLANTLIVLAFGVIANVLLYAVLLLRHYKPFKNDSVTVDA